MFVRSNRSGWQQRLEAEGQGGTSYLSSVSDLMVGVLFIFIVALAIIVMQLKDSERRREEMSDLCGKLAAVIPAAAGATASMPCSAAGLMAQLAAVVTSRNQALALSAKLGGDVALLAGQLTESQNSARTSTQQRDRLLAAHSAMHALRADFLKRVQERLKHEFKIDVEVELGSGILRLAKVVTFMDASAELDPTSDSGRAVNAISDVLVQELPCYVASGACTRRPGGETRGVIDAMLIEGHTDRRTLAPSPRFRDNYALSTGRAWATYNVVKQRQPLLGEMLNSQGQPILSQSGYGPDRPVVKNDDNSPLNRRIDIRFIMAPAPAWLATNDGG